MWYVGVMSGTSCDGVDVVLVDFSAGYTPDVSGFFPYPDELKQRLLQLINDTPQSISAVSDLDAELGRVYADAILSLLNKHDVDADQVEAIGMHGQTVFHKPEGDLANTMQLGSAAITATETGITTVANFRQMDLASGGQGAPLAPILHQQLFYQAGKNVAVLNLGGIANITLLNDEGVIGFDTGPANCLMDEWIHSHRSLPYDDAGSWAEQGQLNQDLLSAMLTEPYFHLSYPKSTGRELFNYAWLTQQLNDYLLSPVDVQRTLLQLTVESVKLGLLQTAADIDQVVVCGGGAHNSFMLSVLSDTLDVPVASSATFGLHPDYVEAVLMAWLAYQKQQNNLLNLTTITGARTPLLYGVNYQPI